MPTILCKLSLDIEQPANVNWPKLRAKRQTHIRMDIWKKLQKVVHSSGHITKYTNCQGRTDNSIHYRLFTLLPLGMCVTLSSLPGSRELLLNGSAKKTWLKCDPWWSKMRLSKETELSVVLNCIAKTVGKSL